MATINQINASRTNGARSHGPVTPEGKARVAQNGTTHGIYTKQVVLQNEDHAAYVEMREAYLAQWAPTNQTEEDLVVDIVDARWRLGRFSALETAGFDLQLDMMRTDVEQIYESIDEGTRTVLGFAALITNNRTFEVLQTAIRAQHRIIERAISQILRLRKTAAPAVVSSPETENRKSEPGAAPVAEASITSSSPESTQIPKTKPAGTHVISATAEAVPSAAPKEDTADERLAQAVELAIQRILART